MENINYKQSGERRGNIERERELNDFWLSVIHWSGHLSLSRLGTHGPVSHQKLANKWISPSHSHYGRIKKYSRYAKNILDFETLRTSLTF